MEYLSLDRNYFSALAVLLYIIARFRDRLIALDGGDGEQLDYEDTPMPCKSRYL